MTKARRKAKIWLLQQEKTFADIASMSGFAEATIHNALDGRGSAKTKQAITNALGIQLWDDVPVTERYITVRPGVSIEFPDVELARDWSNELSGVTALQLAGRSLSLNRVSSQSKSKRPKLRAKRKQPKLRKGRRDFSGGEVSH